MVNNTRRGLNSKKVLNDRKTKNFCNEMPSILKDDSLEAVFQDSADGYIERNEENFRTRVPSVLAQKSLITQCLKRRGMRRIKRTQQRVIEITRRARSTRRKD